MEDGIVEPVNFYYEGMWWSKTYQSEPISNHWWSVINLLLSVHVLLKTLLDMLVLQTWNLEHQLKVKFYTNSSQI